MLYNTTSATTSPHQQASRTCMCNHHAKICNDVHNSQLSSSASFKQCKHQVNFLVVTPCLLDVYATVAASKGYVYIQRHLLRPCK